MRRKCMANENVERKRKDVIYKERKEFENGKETIKEWTGRKLVNEGGKGKSKDMKWAGHRIRNNKEKREKVKQKCMRRGGEGIRMAEEQMVIGR